MGCRPKSSPCSPGCLKSMRQKKKHWHCLKITRAAYFLPFMCLITIIFDQVSFQWCRLLLHRPRLLSYSKTKQGSVGSNLNAQGCSIYYIYVVYTRTSSIRAGLCRDIECFCSVAKLHVMYMILSENNEDFTNKLKLDKILSLVSNEKIVFNVQNFILSIVDPLKFPCEREHD